MNAKNTRIIEINTPKIDNEFLNRIKAYTGTIFSFQWSLIFDELMTRNTLFAFLTIELKKKMNFSLKNNSILKTQATNRYK